MIAGPMPMPHTSSALAPLAAAAAACAVSAVVILALLRTGLARRLLDRPNERSMHVTPVPRIGGAGFVVAVAAIAGVVHGALPIQAWIGLAIVAAVSALDDALGLHAASRLPLHLLAAAIAVAGTLGGASPAALVAGTLLVAWSVNLYNFMDGSDALAGGMGVLGFGTLAVAAFSGGDATLAIAAATVAGAACGFLPYNLPPARVFMGDLGSTTLGFLAAALGLLGIERGLWSALLPAMAFMPFLFDATATLLDRALRGERVWRAHREHAYQRLNLAGFGHRRTAIAYAALMATSAAVALGSLRADAEATGFVALLALHAACWLAIRFGTRPRAGRPAQPR
jgi:UDP-N-acetylmuramyl pentapeptide phosphotransferase/UDP-N-acetylglucosamine-1-phosphate transferase